MPCAVTKPEPSAARSGAGASGASSSASPSSSGERATTTSTRPSSASWRRRRLCRFLLRACLRSVDGLPVGSRSSTGPRHGAGPRATSHPPVRRGSRWAVRRGRPGLLWTRSCPRSRRPSRRAVGSEQQVGESGLTAADEARDPKTEAAADDQRERRDQAAVAPRNVDRELGAVAVVPQPRHEPRVQKERGGRGIARTSASHSSSRPSSSFARVSVAVETRPGGDFGFGDGHRYPPAVRMWACVIGTARGAIPCSRCRGPRRRPPGGRRRRPSAAARSSTAVPSCASCPRRGTPASQLSKRLSWITLSMLAGTPPAAGSPTR